MGARASIPAIPGLDTVPYLTSTTALALDRLPRSLLVIGGGVIGVELGQMFARFGVEVTICCRSRLLPEMDPEVSTALQTYLEARSEEHTSELQSLMRRTYADLCLTQKNTKY